MISAKILKSRLIKMSVTTPKSPHRLGDVSTPLSPKSRIRHRVRLFCAIGFGSMAPLPCWAHPTPAATLAQELSQRASATAVLQQHCPTPITVRLLGATAPAPLQHTARLALNVPAGTRLSIRHVLLLCEEHTVSEAWNLYLPDRLTPQARRLLTDGHTPFGRAVGEGYFDRQRLGSQMQALPSDTILENHAILRRKADGMPFAYLIERYKRAALAPFTRTQATNLNAAPHQARASGPSQTAASRTDAQ